MTDEPTVPAPGGPRRSPLHERHVGLGARLGDFGGWSMPLQYTGVVAEHTAVREAVGLFDVSHLGKAVVRGAGARAFVDACLTNDLRRITAGRAQYTLCCEEDTGGVVDDLIVYLRDDDDVFLVPNAANAAEVVARLRRAAAGHLEVEDRHTDYGVLAVQGPRCDEVLSVAGLPWGHPYMSFVDTHWREVPVTVCRTGYTGERGYELVAPAASAGELWDALLAAGEPYGLLPCGLGARDTLRTEMGYPLHGQDLSAEITPVQARTGWAVGWDKPAFWGRQALLRERREGPRRTLRGLEALDRGIPRPHMGVRRGVDYVGEVTSGTFSPTRKVGIGLALLAREVAEGDEVTIDVRGRSSACRVVKPPFVPSHTTF